MSLTQDRLTMLVRTLREQCWLLEELSGLLSAQLGAVRANSREDLERSTHQLESLNHLLVAVDGRRRRQLQSLAFELGQPMDSLRLSVLASHCEAEDNRRLLDLAARLSALLGEISGRRTLLRQLLAKHAEHAGRGLDWLRKLRGQLGTYGRDLRLHGEDSGGRIVDRTA
ncbi:MAG: flagellar export chaperone FlgN [Calditrichaeota bacterium]|nr:flagellar export chaperone FlgN [Candidatus Cloacimonadota bacterium]MCA9788115.1 flagellar export chaperone FlgN [Candidatus Cloacimonadota bacterium]MCB1047335.1 flagellar export chaperone FlgN [Calditrichota bacterium]MCB9474015.1 flagellar export chaperone FlgN [Candidatus Delongbacteria bacterium]